MCRFDIIWICNQSQNKRWSKSIIKTCADQNQSQNMRWSKANIRSICVPQSSLFILIYDPTIINKATLSELISGNLLLRQSQKSIDMKITVHTYKDMVKNDGQVVLFITRKTAVVHGMVCPIKSIEGNVKEPHLKSAVHTLTENETTVINLSSKIYQSVRVKSQVHIQTTGIEKFTGVMRTNREQIQSSIRDDVGDCGKS